LGITVDALAPVLMAQSVFLSGLIANEIWHQNAALPEFKFMIAGVVVFLMLLALLPLTFFLPQMGSARRDALREYGLLASRYTDEFRHKWFQAAEPDGKKLLGTADIQSLADLANSYDVVNEMKALPFGRKAVVRLLILIALPLLPLSLTMVPFEQMVRTLINVLL
jgi:hypothetical protein